MPDTKPLFYPEDAPDKAPAVSHESVFAALQSVRLPQQGWSDPLVRPVTDETE